MQLQPMWYKICMIKLTYSYINRKYTTESTSHCIFRCWQIICMCFYHVEFYSYHPPSQHNCWVTISTECSYCLPPYFLSLTLNMLNSFKDYKWYIPILNCILDLACPKWMKSTVEQQYMLSTLHWQYHVCWCSGDFRSQGISRHGIDP